jgi:hypothetical protein
MRLNVDRDVQAAGGTAARPDLALARQTDLVALVDPGRDGHPERPAPLGPALAAARVARAVDELALAVAARAGGDVDHLAEHRVPDRADLAPAVALRAGRRRRARLRPGALADLAPVEGRELDLLLGPLDRLDERDPEVVAEVRPGWRTGPPAPGAGRRAAEERVEDVAEAGTEVGAGSTGAGHAGPAEQVVGLPLLRVGQDLVGLVELLEPLGGGRVGVDVGVPLLGEPPERSLDLGVAGPPPDLQDLVVVALGDHSVSKDTGGRA